MINILLKNYNKMKKEIISINLVFVFLFLSMIIPLASALTASISNPRVVLYGNITAGETLTINNNVIVNNDNDYDVLINISPGGDWKDRVILEEESFLLKQGEDKEVNYIINIDEEGYYRGDIIITFIEEETKTQLSIAQDVEVFARQVEAKSNSTSTYLIAGLLIAVILVIIGVTVLNSKKSKRKK